MKMLGYENLKNPFSLIAAITLSLIASSCAVSPEIQAKRDEFERTIPSCSSSSECTRKWEAARLWAQQNSDFTIRSESDTRINANSNIISQSGVGVIVNRVENSSGGFQIIADLECFSAYACPDLWDLKINFNQTLNSTP